MKLMADNYEDDHLKSSSHSNQTNHKPSPDQVMFYTLGDLVHAEGEVCMWVYLLVSLCQVCATGGKEEQSFHAEMSQAAQAGSDRVSVCSLQLHHELEKGERESAELQEFANAILQQIADHCPDILEQVVNALEESS
ncbi:RB6I2 protein, partial [Aleadryas rufinucha]|nr:RB6I2 protein [Aleadryas rufinucha]